MDFCEHAPDILRGSLKELHCRFAEAPLVVDDAGVVDLDDFVFMSIYGHKSVDIYAVASSRLLSPSKPGR